MEGRISLDQLARPMLIAEEGQANQGDVALALEMCELAAEHGADGIEFQFFLADEMYAAGHYGHHVYSANELSFDDITKIIDTAKALGLIVQIAGLSPKVIDHCASAGADLFVINASDLTNPFIIDAVSNTGKPFWLAALMASISEIDWVVEYVRARGSNNFGILHGQHVMSSGGAGVPSHLLQLDCIGLLRERYGLPVGFVDHTNSEFVPALAIAKGACCVTKHLAPHDGWEGPDAQIALAPNAFRIARELFDLSQNSSGDSKELDASEIKDRGKHRRSLYTSSEILKGERIRIEDLIALRPGEGGLDPRLRSDIEGCRALKDLPKGHMLSVSDVAKKGI